MKEIILIKKYSDDGIITSEWINAILKEIQKEYILYQIIKMTRVNEYIMDFELLVEKR